MFALTWFDFLQTLKLKWLNNDAIVTGIEQTPWLYHSGLGNDSWSRRRGFKSHWVLGLFSSPSYLSFIRRAIIMFLSTFAEKSCHLTIILSKSTCWILKKWSWAQIRPGAFLSLFAAAL